MGGDGFLVHFPGVEPSKKFDVWMTMMAGLFFFSTFFFENT